MAKSKIPLLFYYNHHQALGCNKKQTDMKSGEISVILIGIHL